MAAIEDHLDDVGRQQDQAKDAADVGGVDILGGGAISSTVSTWASSSMWTVAVSFIIQRSPLRIDKSPPPHYRGACPQADIQACRANN